MKGLFITFEGGEGCGKSTQSLLLYEMLKKKGYRAVHTREPGGTKVSEAVRRIILDPESRIAPMAELFLYETARVQHIADVILPALKAGKIVVCDRFTDATIAYQGYGRGLDLSIINNLNTIAACGLKPDLTIYIDIPPATGLSRARSIKKNFKKFRKHTTLYLTHKKNIYMIIRLHLLIIYLVVVLGVVVLGVFLLICFKHNKAIRNQIIIIHAILN